jgi:putative FmdB family regulatory protein
MPIYDYQCADCGHGLEAIQKLSDAPLTQCPACGNEALKKKVSAPSFRLSGGGWYETDFKTGKQKNLAGDAANKDSGSKEGGGKSSDASPQASSTSAGESKKSADTSGTISAA